MDKPMPAAPDEGRMGGGETAGGVVAAAGAAAAAGATVRQQRVVLVSQYFVEGIGDGLLLCSPSQSVGCLGIGPNQQTPGARLCPAYHSGVPS